MSKQFVIPMEGAFRKGTDTWLTPLNLIKDIGGEFYLDPCAFPNHRTATHLISLPDDGLATQWFGRVWCNPPYSDVEPWLEKMLEHGNGVALVFARMGTKWAQRQIPKCYAVQFLKRRVKFLKADGSEGNQPSCDSMLLYYGEQEINKELGIYFINSELSRGSK